MFSRIEPRLHGETNALYKIRDGIIHEGHVVRDLISGNVNEHGILFPEAMFEQILTRASRRSRIYHPDPVGQKPAREAVSEYYRRLGINFDPGCILITPGTSMAYWYCFKLLANEGDEILCPRPSYPLVDYIALLSGVRLIQYRLDEEKCWAIDVDYLESCISTKTRALALISPHNPTGHVATPDEVARLAEVANRHDLAIISDEVFGEFLLKGHFLPRPAATEASLVFTLNGFSKMFALPGIKFGWMALSGHPDKVRQARIALELISDTFLPVSEIAQASAPEILTNGQAFLVEYVRLIRERWKIAEEYLATCRCIRWVPPDGGFYVTLNLGSHDEDRVAEAILRNNHLLVHPGYFYDMDPQHLVFSYVQEPGIMRDSLRRILRTIEQLQ